MRTLAVLVSVGVALLTVELGARLVWRRLAPSLGRHNVETYLGPLDATLTFNERPHPYLAFENTPGFISAGGVREVNKQGYRNLTDTSQVPTAGSVRVLCLGGSTTYGYMLSPFDTWPSQLERQLNRALVTSPVSGVTHVEVINGGLLYAMVPDLLAHYLFRDRYLGASIIVLHTGGNDIAPLLFEDYSPDYNFFRALAAGHRLRRGERTLLCHSALIRLLYSFWLNDAPALPLFFDKQLKSFDLAEDYYVRNAQRNEPIGFRRNLDLLVRNIVADGAKPVLFPFIMTDDDAYRALKGVAARRARYTRYIRKGSQIALAKDVQVVHDLAARYGVPLVELRARAIPPDYWLDHCHLSRLGEAIKARAVSKVLLPLLNERTNQFSACPRLSDLVSGWAKRE